MLLHWSCLSFTENMHLFNTNSFQSSLFRVSYINWYFMPLHLPPAGKTEFLKQHAWSTNHKNTRPSDLPLDNFILGILIFTKDEPWRGGSTLLEVQKEQTYRHSLKSVWTLQQAKGTLQPPTNEIQNVKTPTGQSSFPFFIKNHSFAW